MIQTAGKLADAGFDGIAIKPASQTIDLCSPETDRVVIDYEGETHLPSPAIVDDLVDKTEVVLTAPVRADGFDPLGDDSRLTSYDAEVGFAFVPGNGAYLDDRARSRAIAPRLAAALDRQPDAWVGTEGIERLALATGATQYELLAPRTGAALDALRTAGFDGSFVVYAPTVLTADRERALDALAGYLRRRRSVKRSLSDASTASARRDILLDAMDAYAIVGDRQAAIERIDALKAAGASAVIGHPVDAG